MSKRSTIINVIANPCDNHCTQMIHDNIVIKQYGGSNEHFSVIDGRIYFPIWVVNPQYLIIRKLN